MSKSKQSKNIDYLSDDDDLEVYNNSDLESDIENDDSNLPTFKKDKTNIEIDNDDNENDYIDDENEDIDDETYEPEDENGDENGDENLDDNEDDDENYNHTYIEDNVNLNDNDNNDMKYEIIVKSENRITSNILSIYEFIELISIRASQITNGSYVFTDINGISDPIEMAKKELLDNKCPLYVKRFIGLNKYELWSPNVMSKPHL